MRCYHCCQLLDRSSRHCHNCWGDVVANETACPETEQGGSPCETSGKKLDEADQQKKEAESERDKAKEVATKYFSAGKK